MMPVQSVTIRAFGQVHTKPLYLCEVCLGPASYGFTVLENNHRRRKWFCKAHIPSLDMGNLDERKAS